MYATVVTAILPCTGTFRVYWFLGQDQIRAEQGELLHQMLVGDDHRQKHLRNEMEEGGWLDFLVEHVVLSIYFFFYLDWLIILY